VAPTGSPAEGADLADARSPLAGTTPAPAPAGGRDGAFGWPVWLAVMAGAAAGTGALRAARARRRRSRAPATTSH